MLSLNILNYVIANQRFKTHIELNDLNANAVNSVLLKHYRNQQGEHFYKLFFDYGQEGESSKDLILTVKIIDSDSFIII